MILQSPYPGLMYMDRRSFLKQMAWWAGASVLPGCAMTGFEASSRPKNVIFILADDLGYGDLGCYGATDILSPNIDRLAETGVKLNRFYAASPVCTPSRGCLLTGMYPQRIGLDQPLMGAGGIKVRSETLPQVLGEAGYHTACIGKWHLGYAGDTLPNALGFDYFYGHRGGKIDYYQHTDTAQKLPGDPRGKHDFYRNETEIFPEGYSTELFTAEAVKYVRENRDNPFFLYLSYNAPHYAKPGLLQAPQAYVRQFAGDAEPTDRQLYAAMVKCMDDGVGQLMQTLETLGLSENTAVFFIGDNGADPEHGGSNGQLRGGKWTLWEGGIRVPCIASAPYALPHGAQANQVVHMSDLYGTALQLVGLEATGSLDGCDVTDVLRGKKTSPARDLCFTHHHPRYQHQKALVRGRWKFLEISGTSYLFDVGADAAETRDLRAQYPERHAELAEAFEQWFGQVGKVER